VHEERDEEKWMNRHAIERCKRRMIRGGAWENILSSFTRKDLRINILVNVSLAPCVLNNKYYFKNKEVEVIFLPEKLKDSMFRRWNASCGLSKTCRRPRNKSQDKKARNIEQLLLYVDFCTFFNCMHVWMCFGQKYQLGSKSPKSTDWDETVFLGKTY